MGGWKGFDNDPDRGMTGLTRLVRGPVGILFVGSDGACVSAGLAFTSSVEDFDSKAGVGASTG